jgi:hypothetical protein
VYTDFINGEERCRVIARKLIYWVAAATITGGTIDATGAMDVVRAHAMTASFGSKMAVAKLEPAAIPVNDIVSEEAAVAAPAPRRLPMAMPAPMPMVMPAPMPADAIEAPAAIQSPVAVETPAVVEAPAVVETPAVAQTPAPVQAPVEAAAIAPVVVEAPAEPTPAVQPAQAAVQLPAAAVPAQPEVAASAEPPATTYELANTDTKPEPALSALAMKPPVEPIIPAVEEEIPTVPFQGRKHKPVQHQPAPAAVSTAPAKVADLTPTVELPRVFEILPRPRPPLTPAQELDLSAKERAKAEKCLANAIYFEARNEPVRGQIAVAQVVLNRVFSPYYPETICGVVYQNAHRRLACQFTFACDGIPDVVREKGPWIRAQRIAKQALDSQNWLPEVGKATHYHATYVRPRWIRDMRKIVKHGQHIFYRPRNWGNGEDEAGWGVASLTHLTPARSKTARN